MCCKVFLHYFCVIFIAFLIILFYNLGMNEIQKYEKTQKTVNIYPSTYNAIVENKGDWNIAVFIDAAVKHYVKTMNDDSDMNKILKNVEEIRDAVRTNLGLNCEVLKQAGILNGNGEVQFKKPD